jgi:hypothetical protein
LAVAVTEAKPFASVVAVVALSVAEAPLDGGAKVTVTPLTALPCASVTVAASAAPKAVLTCVLCEAPPVATIAAADPAVFVRLKTPCCDAPRTVALTAYAPAMVFAVAVTLAAPVESVVAVSVASVADAPLVGTANVTVAPATGLPEPSVTDTASACANEVVTAVDWVPPDVTATFEGAPAVLVRVKSTWPAPEARRAVTRYVPAVPFAVAVTLASPPLSVTAAVALSAAEAPLGGTV